MKSGGRIVRSFMAAAAVLLATGCAATQGSQQTLATETQKRARDLEMLERSAAVAIDRARRQSVIMKSYFLTCTGYVVFPKVTKGGLGIGAAHGKGVVYERVADGPDRLIGRAEVTQGSIGFQIGGQTFSEIIFFEDTVALANFKRGNAEISAAASGVAGGEGGTAVARYENGVAVFVFGEKGLMGEASIGGQGFSFEPVG